MSLIDNMQWRYATKKMNGEKVSQEKLDIILKAASLAPTSSGLQPFEIFVISNKELLSQIQPIAFGQSQIVDCSHLLVFAAWDNYTEERVNQRFDFMNSERGLPLSTTDAYKSNLLGMYLPRDPQVNFEHTARQSYIAMTAALLAAAEEKVDATPMEGFNPVALDELLNLKEKGLRSTVLLPLGYRDEANDWLVNLKKVRIPNESLFTFIY
ncbi:nitroreductase [Emticicia oligotrophica DSM 17448]|uniref:Nitroreductase n=1 Tax=Emticicia oligotrophica (strain DSM 17448 / CIP 109782 / MTCC 6937 / GPTSA100-15) TaxID=929562 RepID=A0ABM5N3A8_EMTOG|nr:MULTISPECIES: nitroreductase family protein [Emticicia]AFK03885.1 nitroreductase [Emticicia oligotrophica DSM 17448]